MADVRFTPNSDRESGLPQTVMSALAPKADMCGAATDVRFGPKADIRASPARRRWASRPRHQAHSLQHPAMPILVPSAWTRCWYPGELRAEHAPSRQGSLRQPGFAQAVFVSGEIFRTT